MTAINMPTEPGFRASRFGLETHTQRFTSEFTNAQQRQLLSGARWKATFTLPKMKREQAAVWQAFLLQLKGGINTFYAYDPDARFPRGAATGTPLVAGGSQTGSSLNIDGATAGVTNWLRPGDYFSVNGEYKMVTSAVTTNGSGAATINFAPALRASPSDNTAILFGADAYVELILEDDMQAMWESNYNGIYSEKTFSAFEALA